MKSSKEKIRQGFKRIANESISTKFIDIDSIKIDNKTQARVNISDDIVIEYAEAMANGAKFPPIVVYYDEKNYYLADGYHRYYAMKANNITGEIEVDRYDGTIRDAILYSLSANATHGLRRTNEDKRKAVMILLQDKEWQNLSSRKLAEMAGVSNRMIGNLKNELGIDTSQILGNDGREYNLETTGKNSQSEVKSRTKYYRLKLDNDYKDKMKEISGSAKLDEIVLFKEAIDYLEKKYLIEKYALNKEEKDNSIFNRYNIQ